MQIRKKLIIVLTVFGLLLCTSLYFAMQWSFDRGLVSYVNQQVRDSLQESTVVLAEYYAKTGSWKGFEVNPDGYRALIEESLPATIQGKEDDLLNKRPSGRAPPRPKNKRPDHTKGNELFSPEDHRRRPGGIPHHERPPEGRHHRPPKPLVDLPGLLDAKKNIVVGRHNKNHLTTPIKFTGKTIGWLSTRPPHYPLKNYSLSAGENVNIAFILLFPIMILFVLGLGLPLSQHFIVPLRVLARETKSIAKGNYQEGPVVKRNDEFGSLSRDIYHLRKTLKKNENARQRWIADISHELRTPLAIILGEIEAMLEGVRRINKTNINSVKQEVDQLNHLVNDLYELSNAEVGAIRYQMVPLNFRDVVRHGVERFSDVMMQNGIAVSHDINEREIFVNGDVQRLNQLLNNLLTNEVKYAKKPSTLYVYLTTSTSKAVLSIEDEGPGVETRQLSRLFDYLYRADQVIKVKAGSGLGLAICKKIVEAHEGSMKAEHSSRGGLKMTIEIPLLA